MSFSDITVKQRNKEAKALKTFLIYGFFLSLILHIGIIAAVVFNSLSKKNKVEEKPIEITFIDMPIQEEVKPESEPEKPKLDIKEKPVKQEVKLNNESNSLNETRNINLDNIPVFNSTPQQQKIQQPSERDDSSFKVSKKFEPSIPKPSVQPQPSKKLNNQPLSTPIPTKKRTSEFKLKPILKPNKPETSQSISKNDTQPKKPLKIRRENNKLQRQKLRTALKQSQRNRETPIKNTQIEENVAIAFLHHWFHTFLDIFFPESRIPEDEAEAGWFPSIISWWEGIYGWSVNVLSGLSVFFVLAALSLSDYSSNLLSILSEMMSKDNFYLPSVRFTVLQMIFAACLYQLEYLVQQRLIAASRR